MRICILTSSYPRFSGDSHAQFVEQLVRAEIGRGHKVTIVAPRNTRYNTTLREERAGARIYRFPYFWPSFLERLNYEGGIPASLRQCWWSAIQLPFFYFMFFFRAIYASRNAQILHAQWIPSGGIAWLISLIRKVPYVVTIRGSDKELIRMRATRWIAKFILKRAAHVTTVNEILKKRVEGLGIPSGKVTTIFNGIENERFSPGDKNAAREKIGLTSKNKVLLFVGNIIKEKGVIDLVKAVKIIAKKHEEIKVLIVGKGSARTQLEHMVWQAGLSNCFHFLGFQSHKKLHEIFQAADIFVLPSYSEGRPNVILEAMASGNCIVASKVGGIPEIIDKSNGVLVRPKDYKGLAEEIDNLLKNPATIMRLGKAAKKWSDKNSLSWDQSAQLFEVLFKRLLI